MNICKKLLFLLAALSTDIASSLENIPSELKEKVIRVKSTLNIKVPIRFDLELTDTDGGEGTVYYTFNKFHRESNTVLIDRNYYEGDSRLLVSLSDGTKVEIDKPPVWSINNEHFVSTSCGGEAQYNPNKFTIGKCTLKAGCKKIFELDEAATSATWLDNNTVKIITVRASDCKEDPKFPSKKCVINVEKVKCE